MLTHRSIEPEIVELSVSSWFYRNRTIAGFDNPARSLYVSIRELLENSLDASEAAGVLPEIKVSLMKVTDENEPQDILTSGPQLFHLIIEDNGLGIERKSIPKLIGKMLTGTKFTHKQSRGTFGLGGSLALLYGQVTTQKPIEIITGRPGENVSHRVVLRLDIENNCPVILEEETLSKTPSDHGTSVRYFLMGDWLRSKKKVIDYFTQTSIIVPYASMRFTTPDQETFSYSRVIDILPKQPREMKPHPRGIDVEQLKNLIKNTRVKNLKAFMKRSFQRVGESIAVSFLSEAGFDPLANPKNLDDQELVSLGNSFSFYDKFLAPSSESLSPAGEAVLRAGITRLEPELIVVRQRKPNVHEGHPFIVEVGVAYGGEDSNGQKLFRFANKIPLLYDEGSDVSTKVIRELNLKNYGLANEDPLSFFVHICSTKIPYKTVGKEYIGNVDSIRREVELGLKDCLRKLGESVRRKQRAQRSKKRENRLRDYYNFIAETLSDNLDVEVTTANLLGKGDE
ncbi:MAG: DNA topoisomerase VI subunit B [Promethearchaeota archaeon]